MLNIYPAFMSEQTCHSISRVLRAAGLPLGEPHSAGAAVVRAVWRSGGGLVICGPRLSDMTALQLAQILGEEAQVVVLEHGLSRVERAGEGLLYLSLPFSAYELAEQVRALLQREDIRQRMRHRSRTPDEEALIIKAKYLLSKRLGIDEPEAHRLLQRLSMSEGIRMSCAAQRIIDA